MIRPGRTLAAALLLLTMGQWTTVSAQGDCLNEDLYPLAPTTPSAEGAVTIISECSFEQEHSVITGIEAGLNYDFTLSSGGYITIRQGAVDGTILAQGYSPVFATASTADDLFVHWNTNDACGLLDDCVVTTVQRLECAPSTSTLTFAEDCELQSYTITLDITSLGDAAALDVLVDQNGDLTTLEDQGLGQIVLGPFPISVNPIITLAHDSDEDCNRVYPIDFRSTCPFLIDCGVEATNFDFCPEPDDERNWLFTSVGTGTLRLRFLQGTISNSFGDSLRIYDGTDATGTLLFEHISEENTNLGPVGSAVNNVLPFYASIDVFSTTGSLFMEMSTDDFGQCGGANPSEDYDAWQWEVVCLDCTLPEVSYTISDDCANDQFSILVDVTDLGDAANLTIEYTVDGSEPNTIPNVGLGIAELGPFAQDAIVDMSVLHPGSSLCNIEFNGVTDSGTCPILIDCGTELQDSTCYDNYSDQRFYYQGTGTFPIALFFDGGELFFGDTIRIYDGGNLDAAVLYEGTAQNLTDLFITSTNPGHLLTIQLTANAFTSCGDGATEEPVSWRVACLDCVPATADFNIVQDCENSQYFIDVVISDLGSDEMPGITTTASQDTLDVTATGTYQIGPFVTGTELEVTVVNDANSLCNVYSGNLVNPVCPLFIDCPGPTLEQTYCYTNYDTTAWAYELVGASGTLRLTFLRGTIERSVYDKLRIYDGADNTAPLLFEHTGTEFAPYELGPDGSAILSTGGIYYGVDVAATGNNLYMEMTSDVSAACGPTYDAWEWEVYCLDCVNPTATFNIVENCTSREYSTEVIITDTGADDPVTATNLTTGTSLTGLGVGVHTFGPYPVDSPNVFRVFNEAYEQCRTTSDTLTFAAEDCISVTCGFDNYTYCYGNNEDRWYTFQSAQNVPLTLAFLSGQMIAGDLITVYNGADETAAEIYSGNNGGNLTGFAVPSGNAENQLTLRIRSNEAGSCDDGIVTTPLTWTVACGGVGIEEIAANAFSLFPNPTNGLLNVAFAEAITGGANVRIIDMSGRTVLDQPLTMVGSERNTIDLRGLQQGNYMVQITTNEWVSTQRVQVTR
jgi:hypothetical protein